MSRLQQDTDSIKEPVDDGPSTTELENEAQEEEALRMHEKGHASS